MEKVFEFYIRTSPEELWAAITDPAIRSQYAYGTGAYSDWTVGSRLEIKAPKSTGLLAEGEILVVDPPRRLIHSLIPLWSDEVKREGASRVTWEIAQIADSCGLTVTHDLLPENSNRHIWGGWPEILSGMKTWLETGKPLTTPGSLVYGAGG